MVTANLTVPVCPSRGSYFQRFTAPTAAMWRIVGPETTLASVTLPLGSMETLRTTSPSVCVWRAMAGYWGITRTSSLGSLGPVKVCTGAVTRKLETGGALGADEEAMPAKGSAVGAERASNLGAATPSDLSRCATGREFSAE